MGLRLVLKLDGLMCTGFIANCVFYGTSPQLLHQNLISHKITNGWKIKRVMSWAHFARSSGAETSNRVFAHGSAVQCRLRSSSSMSLQTKDRILLSVKDGKLDCKAYLATPASGYILKELVDLCTLNVNLSFASLILFEIVVRDMPVAAGNTTPKNQCFVL